MDTMKQCSKCNQFFPATLDYFGKHYTNKDKLRTACKICRRVESKAYHDVHAEQRKQRYQEHREEVNEKSKQYRQTHKDEIKKQRRQYRQDNRKQIREKGRHYRQQYREEVLNRRKRHYQEHREQNIKRMRAYRSAHIERLRESGRQYHASHREHGNKRRRDYYKKNCEQLREKQRAYHTTERGRITHRAAWQRREARKRAIEGTLTSQQIQAKLKAQKYACYYCSTKFERTNDTYIFHLEHTIPLSRPEHTPRHDMNYVVLACPTCNLKKHNKLPHEWYEGGRLL